MGPAAAFIDHALKQDTVMLQACAAHLRRMPFFSAWTDHCEKAFSEGSFAQFDTTLADIRESIARSDYGIPTSDHIRILEEAVLHSPGNRMAFEYLLASLLLNGDLAKLMGYVAQFPQYHYRSYPRHIEEAMLLFLAGQPGGAQLRFPISKATISVFDRYIEAGRGMGPDPTAAPDLTEFKNTYFY